MKLKVSNRQFLSAAIIVFYLIPLLFFSGYSIKLMSNHKSWALLSLGLILVVLGSLSLIFLLFYWEQSIKDLKQNPSLLMPQEPQLHKKEAKVTSLTFDAPAPAPSPPETFTENSREYHLLQTALMTGQKRQEELAEALAFKGQELHKQEEENKKLLMKAEQIAQDYSDYKLFSEEQLKQKQLQLISLQQIVEDQRNEMEKRQDQIHQLDTKIHDLSYEIKTLLYLHQEENPVVVKESKEEKLPIFEQINEKHEELEKPKIKPPAKAAIQSENGWGHFIVQSSNEAVVLLKKCIENAQKLTGASYGNENSRFREYSTSYFAIDQRRLFDSLRGEKGALLLVYSQKDYKLVFANGESKTILGWSPEKFLADFNFIMQEGIQEWKKALHMLTTATESQVRLLAKSKQGQEVILNCHLGLIPSGLFRNYIIGVLYPA